MEKVQDWVSSSPVAAMGKGYYYRGRTVTRRNSSPAPKPKYESLVAGHHHLTRGVKDANLGVFGDLDEVEALSRSLHHVDVFDDDDLDLDDVVSGRGGGGGEERLGHGFKAYEGVSAVDLRRLAERTRGRKRNDELDKPVVREEFGPGMGNGRSGLKAREVREVKEVGARDVREKERERERTRGRAAAVAAR